MFRVKFHDTVQHIFYYHARIGNGSPRMRVDTLLVVGIEMMRAAYQPDSFRHVVDLYIRIVFLDFAADAQLEADIAHQEISVAFLKVHHIRHRRLVCLRITALIKHTLDLEPVADNLFQEIFLRQDAHGDYTCILSIRFTTARTRGYHRSHAHTNQRNNTFSHPIKIISP